MKVFWGSRGRFFKKAPGRRRQEHAMKDNHIKKRGRILRVKKGYNPNSSSIGSGILPFLAFAAGAGVLAIILSNTLESAGKIIKKRAAALEEPGRAEKKSKD